MDCGVASDFATVVVAGLRGDTDLQIDVGLHMMRTFPAPETVTDPMHFFHPRVYTWMSLGEALRGNADASRHYGTRALQLASSRGDVFNVLGAKLTHVEAAAILGELRGTAAAAAAVEREFAAAGGQQWGAAARIVSVWAEAMEGAPLIRSKRSTRSKSFGPTVRASCTRIFWLCFRTSSSALDAATAPRR